MITLINGYMSKTLFLRIKWERRGLWTAEDEAWLDAVLEQFETLKRGFMEAAP
jgi:hypothetical protein